MGKIKLVQILPKMVMKPRLNTKHREISPGGLKLHSVIKIL